jgi:hypothetical protein
MAPFSCSIELWLIVRLIRFGGRSELDPDSLKRRGAAALRQNNETFRRLRR